MPLRIPLTLFILLAINPSLSNLITGTPPHTAASYSRLTLLFSAILESLSPYFAIRALFAVITCFLFSSALKTNFFAEEFSNVLGVFFFKFTSIKQG